MYRILIVEDDQVIARETANILEKWNLCTKCVTNFQDIMPEFIEFDPQLILLDIMLPFFNGHYWCTRIRQVSKLPIVFLSSSADNMNIVMAMNLGADDFSSKPFDCEVLAAKVQAILRRTYDFGKSTALLECGGAVLNLNDMNLHVGEVKISLTRNEFRILETLLERKNQVVSREVIMTKLWESDSFIDDNTLTVNMNRLRKKLEGAGLVDYIVTKKGIGYMVGQ